VEFFEKYAQMWRISDDFWDDWNLLRKQFDYARDWAEFVGKNNTWPDADMLPLGKLRVTAKEGGGDPTKFTPDEQQTVMTLWSIFRSPLIFGGDLPSNDAATTALITNDEVLNVNQHSSGAREMPRHSGDDFRVWAANGTKPGEHYLAVFNLSNFSTSTSVSWLDAGIFGSVTEVRDLWAHKSVDVTRGLEVNLRPHASALYRVTSNP